MLNKYRYNTTIFLVYNYRGEIPSLGEHVELLESNINIEQNLEDHTLPILEFLDFVLAGTGKKRTRDKILEEEGISSFYDLQCAYNLLRNQKLQKSARVRKFVNEKYSEIINMSWKPSEKSSDETTEYIEIDEIETLNT